MRYVDSILGFAFVGSVVIACGGSTVETPIDAGTDADGGSVVDGGTPGDGGGDGTVVDPHACSALTDCALVATGCCGCGESASEVDAIAVSQLAGRPDPCANAVCGPCPEPASPFTRNQYVAACRSDRCVVEDVRTDDLSACTLDSDCVLAVAGCCACGSVPFVALIRAQATAYRTLACTGMSGACPPCEPSPPPSNAEAYCSSTHHCAGRLQALDAGSADGG